MKLDLRPMLRGEISCIPVDFKLDLGDGIRDVSVCGEVSVIGEIVDTAGYMRMTLSAEFDYSGECARCLETINGHFATDFVRTVVDEGTLSEEQLEENVDEYAVISDGFLDIDEEICEALILDFPRKLLCSEDCPGLCQKCGKKLRDGACNCSDKETDPRWDVLKNFFSEGSDKYVIKLKNKNKKYKVIQEGC